MLWGAPGLEKSLLNVLVHLVDWLKAPEQASLQRSFTVWIRRVLLNRLPDMELGELSALQELHEVHGMLAERIKQWPERWEQRGIEKGIEQGREEALLETARNLSADTPLDDGQVARATGLDKAEVCVLRSQQHRSD